MRRPHLAAKRGTPKYDFPAPQPNEVGEIGVAAGELLYGNWFIVAVLLLKKWLQPRQVELLACSDRSRLIATFRHVASSTRYRYVSSLRGSSLLLVVLSKRCARFAKPFE